MNCSRGGSAKFSVGTVLYMLVVRNSGEIRNISLKVLALQSGVIIYI